MMDSVTMENFRCFRERQTVPLAPLTLLVGENSTGKTSFLAMLRVLVELERGRTTIDFKEPPYDLGSFDQIAHSRGGRGGRADEFTIGFERSTPVVSRRARANNYRGEFTFRKSGSTPRLFTQTLSTNDAFVEEELSVDGAYRATLRNDRGAWTVEAPVKRHARTGFGQYRVLLQQPYRASQFSDDTDDPVRPRPIDGSAKWQDEYVEQFLHIDRIHYPRRFRLTGTFAGAPVRSKPKRTYDPARLDSDPQGDYVPMYLADLSSRHGSEWETVKGRLNEFGQTAGLYDEVSIRQLGLHGSDPFQIQMRKGAGRRKGAMRNLADVGYGVSQVLPVVTELLRPDAPEQFLLQQPEVHLHPSAQAALGTLFCQVAATRRQLVIETHSDHLIDRVRMDVRDGTTDLKPEDVSLLYFERTGLDVCIHPIRFDKLGNVLDAPPGYRQFFLREVNRSLGL